MKKFFNRGLMALASAIALVGCADKTEELALQGTRALDVQVSVQPTSRAMVKGTALAEGAGIGVNVTAADGGLYDGKDEGYLNVLYTATGTGSNQEWNSTTPVMLSGTEGKMYAYYPHTTGADFKAISVDITDQKDWMYGAEAYTVSDKAPSVAVTLKHAQTAVNVNMVRDNSYTGAGVISDLAVKSEGLATAGTLDTRDGSWSSLSGANTAISIISETFTLDGSTKSSQENPYMFIPAADATKDFVVTATVDGKTYNSNVTMKEAFAKGKVYSVNLKMTNVGLTVSQVTLVDWDEVTLDEGTFQPESGAQGADYSDWVKLTYNVTDAAQPVDIFCTLDIEEGVKVFDIANVTDMMVMEGGSRTAAEPQVVTPEYQYTFSSTDEHTVYVKFEDMTKVPGYAFTMCTALVDFELPNSVTEIGYGAFGGCAGLTGTLIFPNSVQTIGQQAFVACLRITEVTIPNSVKTIGEEAFVECSGITGTLTIPNSVQTIGEYAFNKCTGMTGVTIGSGVQTIGQLAFAQCTGITAIMVDVKNTVYDSRNNCNAIMETETNKLIQGCNNTIIPEDCLIIGGYAFYGCSGVTGTLNIPETVTTIQDGAFGECTGITEVTIPEAMTSIGNRAFYKCSNLVKITSLATTAPSIQSSTFDSVKTGGILYVPQGATGYDTWMGTDIFYLGKYNWTMQTISE